MSLFTKYIHAHYAPHSMWKFDWTKWHSLKLGQDNTLLSSTYSIQGSVSELNRLGGDGQAVSCHCYLLVFHLIVE